jgi:hypothetical protein
MLVTVTRRPREILDVLVGVRGTVLRPDQVQHDVLQTWLTGQDPG